MAVQRRFSHGVIAGDTGITPTDIFEARPGTAINNVTGMGEWYQLVYNTVEKSAPDDVSLNTGTGAMTLLTDGIYIVEFAAYITYGSSAGADDWRVQIRKNGSPVGSGIVYVVNARRGMGLNVCVPVNAVENDVITCWVRAAGGTFTSYDILSGDLTGSRFDVRVKRLAGQAA